MEQIQEMSKDTLVERIEESRDTLRVLEKITSRETERLQNLLRELTRMCFRERSKELDITVMPFDGIPVTKKIADYMRIHAPKEQRKAYNEGVEFLLEDIGTGGFYGFPAGTNYRQYIPDELVKEGYEEDKRKNGQ